MRERKKRARWMRGGMLLALLVIPFTACDLEITNPGQVTEDKLEDPASIDAILNGLIGDVEASFDNLVLHTGLASDELKFSGTRSWLFYMGLGDMRPEDAQPSWEPAAVAMWTTVQGIDRLTALGADAEDVATANLYAGFIHRIAGETFCKAVFNGGAVQDRSAYFERALSHFQAAQSAGGSIATAAKAGSAQVLLNLGRYNEAAAAAADVPNTFKWWAYYNPNDESLLWEETQDQTQASVWQTPIGDAGEGFDPRAPFIIRDKATAGGDPVYYRQEKYPDNDDDHLLAHGWDMRLIEAEVFLQQGLIGPMIDKVNEVRSAFGLADVSAANETEAWEILKWEKLVTNWLEGRRLMDLHRWNDSFLSGRDYCFPFSDSEINSNPNLQGCTTGPECS